MTSWGSFQSYISVVQSPWLSFPPFQISTSLFLSDDIFQRWAAIVTSLASGQQVGWSYVCQDFKYTCQRWLRFSSALCMLKGQAFTNIEFWWGYFLLPFSLSTFTFWLIQKQKHPNGLPEFILMWLLQFFSLLHGRSYKKILCQTLPCCPSHHQY